VIFESIKNISGGNVEELPNWVRRLNTFEVEELHDKFWGFCYRAMEKFGENPCAEFLWPRHGVQARAIPGDIHPLAEEHGFSHEKCLEAFFAQVSPSGLVYWDHDVVYAGSFLGPYDKKMRFWVADKLIATTWCAVSPDCDLAMVMERDLDASMIMGSDEMIRSLESAFGGPDALKQAFVDHVERGDFGHLPRFSSWAYEHIFPKCGWSI